MTTLYLGCYPPTILDQSTASASGTATIMDPIRCEQLCHEQETALFKSHNTTVNFKYFYLRGNQCQCAPAIISSITKLNDNDCSDRNSINVQLYFISSGLTALTPTITMIPNRPSSTISDMNSSHSTTTTASTSSFTSTDEPSIDSLGLIIGLSVAVIILIILGVTCFLRHRRRANIIKSMSLTSTSHFIPSNSRDFIPTLSSPKLSKPSMQLGKNAIIPTKSPDITTTTKLPPLLSQPETNPKFSHKQDISHTTIDHPPTFDSSYTPTPIYSQSEILTNLPIVSDDEVCSRGVYADPYRQYRVHRGYQPSLDDELTLITGEFVLVKEVFDDGWVLGRPIILSPHHQGIIEGVFPLICLLPELEPSPTTTITSPTSSPPHIINPLLPQPVTQNLVVTLASPTCQPETRLVRLPNEVTIPSSSPPLPSSSLGGTLSSSYVPVTAFQERRSSLMVSTISGD